MRYEAICESKSGGRLADKAFWFCRIREAFVFIMADCMGAWPGDQPKAVRGMDISMATLTVRLLTKVIHAVQIELARSRVAVEKISSRAVRRKRDFIKGHGGLKFM
jgi:hypothetical protein